VTAGVPEPVTGAGGTGFAPEHVRVAIIGAGFSGLGLAIRLHEAGIRDIAILEKAREVGGTWRENTYPGVACDVPSHLYSLSFAPNPGWSRMFAPGGEIQQYLVALSRSSGVRPLIRFGCEVIGADWDEASRRWRIRTTRGELSAQVLVSAPGPLHEPALPDVPGIGAFQGTAFHSACWDHDHDLTGERIAVVGTGASAIQFVPEIQPRARSLTVFQRTAPWVVPRIDHAITPRTRKRYRERPWTQTAMRGWVYASREIAVLGFMHPRLMSLPERAARAHLARQVADPELRAKLVPTYRLGCKRVLPSNDWYPALQQPNVDLVASGVREIREHTIVAGDGSEHAADTIIFGTGYRVFEMPIGRHVRGRGGQALAERWQGSPSAYLGATVAGFPNLFLMVGPNTGLGHNSIVLMIESQIAYILDALRLMDARGVDTVEVSDVAEAAFNEQIDVRLSRSVWNAGGCSSYYLDDTGRNSSIWPGSTLAYRLRTRRFDASRYRATRPGSPAV